MAVAYHNQVAITDYLIERLEIGLSGRGQRECLDKLPHDKYHLGVLAPQHASGETISQPEIEETPDTQDEELPVVDEEETEQSAGEETDDEPEDYTPSQIENEESVRLSRENLLNRRGASSSIGIEFMVNTEAAFELELNFEFAFYTRRFPTWEQIQDAAHRSKESGSNTVSIRDRHVRHDCEVGPIALEIQPATAVLPKLEEPFKTEIDRILDNERQRLDVWRQLPRMSMPLRAVKNENTYYDFLSHQSSELDIPPIEVYLDIRTLRMPDGAMRVSIYLVNGTHADERSIVVNATRHIIDARLSCSVFAALTPIEIISAPEDYQYDPRVWAVGHGCSAYVGHADEGVVIETESLSQYNQPRLTTRNEPATPFETLANDPLPLLYDIHDQMNLYAREWEQLLETGKLHLDSTLEINACHEDLEAFVEEAERFHSGIMALEQDSRLREAFKAMHRVFQRVGEPREIESWRLFQIGFIVTQLPSLAVREGFETNALGFADVLWFPTGGGKTEAYLGLISCALIYDRLRGRSDGVTAWLRFPLRMLSVQQLQRAIKVVYETEVERQLMLGEDAKESTPFGLGYLVGKSSTPNQLGEANWAGQWKLSNLAQRKDVRDKLKLVRDCPQCGNTTVEIVVDVEQVRVKHICQTCGLDLNIFVSDDEIFRYLPSVLVGTVDKLPSVAWRRQFAHIWGNVDKWCPKHGFTSGKYCMVWGCKSQLVPVSLYDPVPALQIQDELHLLREELGTFAGHYETLATTCQSRIAQPPKILAATATVEGLDRQSPHLYNLPARRFPSRGYQLGQSFYTKYARQENGIPRIARRYLAFKPPFLRPPEASADVLEILHSEIRALYLELETKGPEALAQALRIETLSHEDAIELLDKYNITLTYVGAKAHGSRVERELTNRGRSLPKAGSRDIKVSYLNGESTLDDIASTIGTLETVDDWDDEERLDAVIGTSLISHGVDVSRFNLMVMSGMPGRTAEYIQSSSRSGRSYVGIIIVALSPWLLREQSMYHRFGTYHYHMEHMVEPVPINRFSRFAADKTVPGVLAGVLNAYFSPLVDADLSRTIEVQKLIYENAGLSEEELLKVVEEAFALDSSQYAPSLRLGLEERVVQRLKSEMRRLSQPGAQKRVTNALSRKPMTSLRDVDEPVPFDPKEYSYSKLHWLQ